MVTFQVDALRFSYIHGFSLRNISFSVDSGQLCALLGPNGCGKTTLIKCLAGAYKIAGGSVQFGDADLSVLKQHEVAKLLSYVPQSHDASFSYRVIEMVVMGRNPHVNFFSTPSGKDLAKSVGALEALNISHLRDELYPEISSGQQKLVLIARALAQEAPIMLLDEPTAHLDFKNKLLVLRSIKKLVAHNGLTVLMSLHDPNEVALVADQTIIMNNGEIITQGPTKNVLTPECIKEIYGVNVDVWGSGERKMFVPTLGSLGEDV